MRRRDANFRWRPQPFPFADNLDQLKRRCPEYVEPERWRQCIKDAERFLATWGDKALALGWNSDKYSGSTSHRHGRTQVTIG